MKLYPEGPWQAVAIRGDRLQRWCVLGPSPGVGKPILAENIRTEAQARAMAAVPEMVAVLKAVAMYSQDTQMQSVARATLELAVPGWEDEL